MSTKRPVIIYLDDEPRNLTVFEASLPETWDIKTYTNPLKALEDLKNLDPAVVVSDQRMPIMSGVEFLEKVKNECPHAVRIVVTGFSEEDLVIESVRKAQIFDYIKKPWEPEDLEKAIIRAISHHTLTLERIAMNQTLEKQNTDLRALTAALEASKKEIECWVPPFVLWAVNDRIKFPVHRDLVGIAFDIIKSRDIHDVVVDGKPLRSLIIQTFTEIVLSNGGWRESHAGDSAYAHFGLLEKTINPYEAALKCARQFREALKEMNLKHLKNKPNGGVHCGISLHVALNCKVDVHIVQLDTPNGAVIQKSFDTTSKDVDLLHRIEKFIHKLPGTNIVLTEPFVSNLTEAKKTKKDLVFLGKRDFLNQGTFTLFLDPDPATPEDQIAQFIDTEFIDEDRKVA